jgi:hypothetical protein
MKSRRPAFKEDIEKFELFLFEMDDVLDAFLAQASQSGIVLDYSTESLDQLEAILDAQPGTSEEAETIRNRAARYLGEVFRKQVGGRWELCLREPKSLYFKLPVVSGYAKSGIEFCPVEVIANFLHSRKKGLLRGALAAHAEFRTV